MHFFLSKILLIILGKDVQPTLILRISQEKINRFFRHSNKYFLLPISASWLHSSYHSYWSKLHTYLLIQKGSQWLTSSDFKMYLFFLPIFTLIGLVAANCDTGICPGSFPNKTLEQTFGDQVKTCCSGHNSYIFTDFCDVSTFNSCFIHPIS